MALCTVPNHAWLTDSEIAYIGQCLGESVSLGWTFTLCLEGSFSQCRAETMARWPSRGVAINSAIASRRRKKSARRVSGTGLRS